MISSEHIVTSSTNLTYLYHNSASFSRQIRELKTLNDDLTDERDDTKRKLRSAREQVRSYSCTQYANLTYNYYRLTA